MGCGRGRRPFYGLTRTPNCPLPLQSGTAKDQRETRSCNYGLRTPDYSAGGDSGNRIELRSWRRSWDSTNRDKTTFIVELLPASQVSVERRSLRQILFDAGYPLARTMQTKPGQAPVEFLFKSEGSQGVVDGRRTSTAQVALTGTGKPSRIV